MNEEMGEYPIVMFTAYKRSDGFEVSLTFRGSSIENVAKNMDSAIKSILEKGGTPIAKNSFNKPQVPTKPCPKHNQPMKERPGKNGKPNYWSHNRGVYPNLEWCSGGGFPGELGQEVDEVFEKYE